MAACETQKEENSGWRDFPRIWAAALLHTSLDFSLSLLDFKGVGIEGWGGLRRWARLSFRLIRPQHAYLGSPQLYIGSMLPSHYTKPDRQIRSGGRDLLCWLMQLELPFAGEVNCLA